MHVMKREVNHYRRTAIADEITACERLHRKLTFEDEFYLDGDCIHIKKSKCVIGDWIYRKRSKCVIGEWIYRKKSKCVILHRSLSDTFLSSFIII
jgi:hypothetical protein